jgi:hypothetical protein
MIHKEKRNRQRVKDSDKEKEREKVGHVQGTGSPTCDFIIQLALLQGFNENFFSWIIDLLLGSYSTASPINYGRGSQTFLYRNPFQDVFKFPRP